MNKKTATNRRDFLKNSSLAAAGFMIVPRHVLGGKGFLAPSDRLNIAAIGVGGKGDSNLRGVAQGKQDNIVALCDVDDRRAKDSFKRFKKARRFRDYRKMLDEMGTDIDAVIISTPDHTHAITALAAMKRGKHVYVEKPLTHSVYEARVLTLAARKYGVMTQMGNQGNSGDDIRRICEWIWAGTIGEVREVHCWTNRPVWPQGMKRPSQEMAVPDSLDWDLWLGPAPERPYHSDYVPFSWRGWWDFGTGALGDMACHIIDPAFKALKLGYPDSVEASVPFFYKDWNRVDSVESPPLASVIHFDFPARDDMPALSLHWYDGGMMPRRPIELEDNEKMGDNGGGVLFVGDKGKIMCDTYARNPRLLPTKLMKDFSEPSPSLERVRENHQRNWVTAIKEGKAASSNFDYAGPLTETILMGNLAIRSLYVKENNDYTGVGKRLNWDGQKMRITNYEPANAFVKRAYRDGWAFGEEEVMKG